MSYHRRPSNTERDALDVLACLAHLTRSTEPDPIDPYDLTEGDTTP